MGGEVFEAQSAGAAPEVAAPLVSPGVVAAAGSHLEDLRARREKAISRLFLDKPVPGLKPTTVRFRPLEVHELERVAKAFEGQDSAQAALRHDATLLATACVAVWDKTAEKPEPPQGAPTFAHGVAELLGINAEGAADAVLGLYLTQGDVTGLCRKVLAWSGFSVEEVDRDLAGN